MELRSPHRLSRFRVARHLALFAAVFAGQAGAQSSPFLWEVAGESGKAYLLGSVHVGKEDFYPLPPAVEKAFANADTLVVEVNPTKEEQAALSMKMLMAGVYKDGRTLEQGVDPETFAQFAAFLEERKVPLHNFQSMRPWMAALLITVTEIQRMGFNPELGIDRHFMDAAKQSGKRIEPLETAAFQIELLSGFPEELQEQFLIHTLRDVDKMGDAMDEMAAAWQAGDEAKMTEFLLGADTYKGEMAELGDKLIWDRNVTMAEKIGDLIASGGTWFVVVGAGHLLGDRGVPKLLAKDGRNLSVSRAAQ